MTKCDGVTIMAVLNALRGGGTQNNCTFDRQSPLNTCCPQKMPIHPHHPHPIFIAKPSRSTYKNGWGEDGVAMDVVEVRMATVGDSVRSTSCATPWPATNAWAPANRLPVLSTILSFLRLAFRRELPWVSLRALS